MNNTNASLGAVRNWIYPASVGGRFQRLHRKTGAVLLAVLLGTPWLEVRGAPLILADLASRRLFLLGMVFTPRDTILLLLLVLSLSFALFLFTSLFGRLWCGYGCPQTVLVEEIVRRLETAIEGERGRRMRRDRGPWTWDKIWRRSLKWTLFAVTAIVLAGSFTSLFTPARELWLGQSPRGAYLFAGAFAGFLVLDFVWFREQFCHFLCPYARFQSALFDARTVSIGYDEVRGEPRKPRGVSLKDWQPATGGGCVDCNRCVAVCPSGIDIREGFQLECIGCARCIDACEDVMGRLQAPSLVRYASLAELTGKRSDERRFRPALYGALLGVCLVATGLVLAQREPFELIVAQHPATAETHFSDGRTQNLFQLTIFNNLQEPRQFEVDLQGLDGAVLVVPTAELLVAAAGRRTVPAFVTVPPGTDAGPITPIVFRIQSGDVEIERPATFRNLPPSPEHL